MFVCFPPKKKREMSFILSVEKVMNVLLFIAILFGIFGTNAQLLPDDEGAHLFLSFFSSC